MTAFSFDPGWDQQDLYRNHNELLEGEVVLWRNAQWRVTNYYLEAMARPELVGPPYFIEISAIEFDLALRDHVCQKNWVDQGLFIEAYDKARELHGFGISWCSKYETLDALAAKLGINPRVPPSAREKGVEEQRIFGE
jgi:hypothetical protein